MKTIYADDATDTAGDPPGQTTRAPHDARRRTARSASSARVGLRLARRELRRRPWRTALVVLVILVPTTAMTVAVMLFNLAIWSPVDAHEAEWGQADAQAWPTMSAELSPGDGAVPPPPPPPLGDGMASADQLRDLEEALPSGSTIALEHIVYDRVRDGDNRTYVQVNDLPIDHPMAEGRYESLEGRAAAGPDEAIITDDLADASGIAIGDIVHPDRLDRDVTVTGIVVPQGYQDSVIILGAPLESGDPVLQARSFFADQRVLIDLPGRPFLDAFSETADAVQSGALDPNTLHGADLLAGLDGLEGVDTDELLALLATDTDWTVSPLFPDTDQLRMVAIFWTYVAGGIALIVLGTIVTAAFAISARRQLHTIGLLSASGAPPKTIQRFLVAQGGVTGFVGAVAGISLGVLLVFLAPRDRLDEAVGHHIAGIDIPVLTLLPVLVLGIAGAAFAARIPARSASQVSTLQALAGRRPLPEVPARLPLYGAVALLGGCALFAMSVAGSRNGGSSLWALVAIGGGLSVLAGTWGITPWAIAQLERWSGQWPETGRLAARSLARNRVRSSAVVAAICAVAAVLVGGSTLAASAQANSCCEGQLPWLQDDQLVVGSYRHSMELYDPDGDGPLEPEWSEWAAVTPVDEEVVADIQAIVPDARRIDLAGFVNPSPADTPELTSAGTLFGNFVGTNEAWGNHPYNDNGVEIGIATPAVLDYFDVPDRLRHALGRGEAVVLTDVPDTITAIAVNPLQVDPSDVVTIEIAGSVGSPNASSRLPTVLISEQRANELGYDVEDGYHTLFALDRPLTSDQQRSLETLRDDQHWEQQAAPSDDESWTSSDINIPEHPAVSEATIRAAILAGAFLLMLAVVGIGLALAAKDNEDERQVLSAVGAPPSTLRRVGAMRAVLLVLTAVAIAVPAGLLPAAAIWSAASSADQYQQEVFALDWSVLGFVVVATPLLVGLVVWTTGWLRDKVRPLRPDSFTFAD